MVQEKVQEEALRAPASGKGDELEMQTMLLDSWEFESFLSALSTDPAAIPENSHLLHLKGGQEKAALGNEQIGSPGRRREKEQLYKKVLEAAEL